MTIRMVGNHDNGVEHLRERDIIKRKLHRDGVADVNLLTAAGCGTGLDRQASVGINRPAGLRGSGGSAESSGTTDAALRGDWRAGLVGIGIDQKVDAFMFGITELGLIAKLAHHFAQRQAVEGNIVEPDAVQLVNDDLASRAGVGHGVRGIGIADGRQLHG